MYQLFSFLVSKCFGFFFPIRNSIISYQSRMFWREGGGVSLRQCTAPLNSLTPDIHPQSSPTLGPQARIPRDVALASLQPCLWLTLPHPVFCALTELGPCAHHHFLRAGHPASLTLGPGSSPSSPHPGTRWPRLTALTSLLCNVPPGCFHSKLWAPWVPEHYLTFSLVPIQSRLFKIAITKNNTPLLCFAEFGMPSLSGICVTFV